MPQKKMCSVCKEMEHKYRCPNCKILYCSLGCFKEHKDKTCELQEDQGTQLQTETFDIIEDRLKMPEWNLDEIETEDTVSKSELQLLGQSLELKAMLNNPHLRRMMKALVSTNTPTKELDTAMQEPIFAELADKCVAIINNRDDITEDDFPEIEDL